MTPGPVELVYWLTMDSIPAKIGASKLVPPAAGGTSFDAPIFAGMLSIVNQYTNSTGPGVIYWTLYSLASNATTYASAFHDITSGNNECTAGSTYCNSA